MRIVTVAIIATFITLNANAGTTPLDAAITKSIGKQVDPNPTHHSSIVYGGKDLSRSIVAVNHETNWVKHPVLIG